MTDPAGHRRTRSKAPYTTCNGNPSFRSSRGKETLNLGKSHSKSSALKSSRTRSAFERVLLDQFHAPLSFILPESSFPCDSPWMRHEGRWNAPGLCCHQPFVPTVTYTTQTSAADMQDAGQSKTCIPSWRANCLKDGQTVTGRRDGQPVSVSNAISLVLHVANPFKPREWRPCQQLNTAALSELQPASMAISCIPFIRPRWRKAGRKRRCKELSNLEAAKQSCKSSHPGRHVCATHARCTHRKQASSHDHNSTCELKAADPAGP